MIVLGILKVPGKVRSGVKEELSGTIKPNVSSSEHNLYVNVSGNAYSLTTAFLTWLCTLLSHLERRQSRSQKSMIFRHIV